MESEARLEAFAETCLGELAQLRVLPSNTSKKIRLRLIFIFSPYLSCSVDRYYRAPEDISRHSNPDPTTVTLGDDNVLVVLFDAEVLIARASTTDYAA